ncbi:MAG: ParA family protein [Gammaproteobacteria bacterium]|nr:ParA family protein [Gammaproteobacteria bacterium]
MTTVVSLINMKGGVGKTTLATQLAHAAYAVIVKNVGYLRDTPLDLIPSRLELSRTLKNPTGKERRLAKGLSRVGGRYDLVIID